MSKKYVGVVLGVVLAGCGLDAGETSSAVISAHTVVSLTFDDTLADQFQVGDLAAAHGMRVTFFVNSPRFDTSGYLTTAQVITLEQQGHEIGGHTLDHANLPTLSDADAQTEVCDDRDNLLARGFRVTSFAYPFGADNSTDWSIVQGCGYNSARDVGGLKSAGACPGCPWTNPVPPTNLYEIRTNDSIQVDTPLSTIEEYVTDAEQNGGGYVPIVFHHVCDGCDQNSVTYANLSAFLDWLQQRAPATQVGTIDQEIGGPVEPPAQQTLSATNLAKNPSLETDADGNQVPDCWQRGGYGTSSATYSLTSDAFDGSVAQLISVTSLSSGGRRLVTAQDSGACAPPVTVGHHYTMTAYYKASTPPMFTVYYRNSSGSWVWFAQSPQLPTSSTYTQATYTSPPMPSGATAISIGLGIFAVGSITMDDYTLVDADATGSTPSDTTPPSISIACGGVPCSPNPYTQPVAVSLAGWDFSGISQIRYTTDGSDPATSGAVYSSAFTVSSTTTVRALGIDNAGNTRALTRTIQLSQTDTTPPALSIACNGTTCSSSAYTSSVSVSLAATDASGIAAVRYTTDGSDPTTGTVYAGPFTVSATSTVRAVATDNAGNATQLAQTITISTGTTDTTPPALSIACNGTSCAATYTAPVSVTLTASDASGIASLRYTTDGSDPTAGTVYSGPFTVNATATVRAIATDNAGNATTLTQTITISSGTTNLLKNPSLETDADGNQVPDCWQRGGYGTNSATFTLTSDAFDGVRAQNITITSFSSGGRRLVSAQDSGACAPAVTPGRTYTVTAHYKANVQPKFSVYYRNTSGSWVWFAESPSLPTASSYAQATYTTPAMPSGATAISVGLSIFGVGSLTTDAYTLVAN